MYFGTCLFIQSILCGWKPINARAVKRNPIGFLRLYFELLNSDKSNMNDDAAETYIQLKGDIELLFNDNFQKNNINWDNMPSFTLADYKNILNVDNIKLAEYVREYCYGISALTSQMYYYRKKLFSKCVGEYLNTLVNDLKILCVRDWNEKNAYKNVQFIHMHILDKVLEDAI
jgi:hypothetical protein